MEVVGRSTLTTFHQIGYEFIEAPSPGFKIDEAGKMLYRGHLPAVHSEELGAAKTRADCHGRLQRHKRNRGETL